MNDLEIDLATQLAEALAEVERLQERDDRTSRSYLLLRTERDGLVTEVERLQRLVETVDRQRIANGDEVERLQRELHQARAEWFEEKKRARESETEVERLRDYQTEKYDELADALTEYRAALERIAKEPHRGITIRVDAENMRSYARAALAKEEA